VTGNLDELSSEASKKLLGLFEPEASPVLAGHKERGRVKRGAALPGLHLRRPCLRGLSSRNAFRHGNYNRRGHLQLPLGCRRTWENIK